jgi:16S rRNA (cytidine1402-2'-O)-methyltransferase
VENENESKKLQPALYVVATPIGNLSDLSPRAIEVLANCDLILAEDTRHFGKLASHFNISSKKLSLHEHNEVQRIEQVISAISEGSSVSLVSDAGTPCVSDPGFRIVQACREQGVEVSTCPGPCAAIAALSISGLPCDQFVFKGFVPSKSGKRETFWKSALDSGMTNLAYESPHRIIKSLQVLAQLDPERKIFIARELTKLFEENLFGTTRELHDLLAARPKIKGEFVIVLSK